MEIFSNESAGLKNNFEPIFETDDAIPPFSEREAQLLSERLMSDEEVNRREAQQILISWMMRGECNKSNSATFYNLIKLCLEFLQKLKLEESEERKSAEKAEKNLDVMKYLIKLELEDVEDTFKAMEEQGDWGSLTSIENELLCNLKSKVSTLSQEVSLGCANNEMKIREPKFGKSPQVPVEQQNPVEDNIINPVEYNITYEVEMSYVSLISVVLHENKYGLNVCGIKDYLSRYHLNATANELLFILKKYPKLFNEIKSGQDHKWIFVALNL